jgi:preprotein translocase subunit YajC
MMIFMGRSSARQKREAAALLANLKKNDKVVTAAGIIGVVVSIKENENEVTLRVDDTSNSRVTVLRSSITSILNPQPAAQPTENKTS